MNVTIITSVWFNIRRLIEFLRIITRSWHSWRLELRFSFVLQLPLDTTWIQFKCDKWVAESVFDFNIPCPPVLFPSPVVVASVKLICDDLFEFKFDIWTKSWTFNSPWTFNSLEVNLPFLTINSLGESGDDELLVSWQLSPLINATVDESGDEVVARTSALSLLQLMLYVNLLSSTKFVVLNLTLLLTDEVSSKQLGPWPLDDSSQWPLSDLGDDALTDESTDGEDEEDKLQMSDPLGDWWGQFTIWLEFLVQFVAFSSLFSQPEVETVALASLISLSSGLMVIWATRGEGTGESVDDEISPVTLSWWGWWRWLCCWWWWWGCEWPVLLLPLVATATVKSLSELDESPGWLWLLKLLLLPLKWVTPLVIAKSWASDELCPCLEPLPMTKSSISMTFVTLPRIAWAVSFSKCVTMKKQTAVNWSYFFFFWQEQRASTWSGYCIRISLSLFILAVNGSWRCKWK